MPSAERARRLQGELIRVMAERLSDLPVAGRLVPYLQLHEFEALLFSDPTCFLEAFPKQQEQVAKLCAIRDAFAGPEDINHDSAPSMRILQLFPAYQKPVADVLIARRIGLPRIRRDCRHFNAWFDRLVGLTAPGGNM